VDLVLGTREGEIVALASGLWLGGARPLVLIQNTGLLESGDGLRGTASRMGAPVLLLVTCRGFAKARKVGRKPGEGEITRDLLVRPDLDSVAEMTHSTLRAWGIPFFTLRDVRDLGPIREGWALAHEEERPVAVLLDVSFDHD
jgi:sulfopyruvate decarboxylase TPP-binding subunit